MNVFLDVRAFHVKCRVPVLPLPGIPSPARVELRDKLIQEERAELGKAMATKNLPEIADGICDLIYVLVGTALEYGIPLDKCWAAVQAANMAKEPGNERADGKILKPEGWMPPDIDSILAEASRA